MVLDSYFVAKSRLKPALETLQELHAGANGGAMPDLDHSVVAIEGLPEAFCVVVAGVPGSGRSALVDVLQAEVGDGLQLDEVAVQGAESVKSHRPALDSADAVICVLDSVEPWCSTIWAYLKALPDSMPEKLLIAVQRSDLRPDTEQASVLQHMSEELRRLGVACTVVSVSAHLAKRAHRNGAVDDKMRAQCGIDHLCDVLGRTLAISTECFGVLKRCTDAGTADVEALRAKVDEVADEMEDFHGVRGGITQLSESLLAQTDGKLSAVIAKLDRSIQDAIGLAENELWEVPARLGKGEAGAFVTKLQVGLRKRIANANIRAIEEAASLLEAHMDACWSQVGVYLNDHHRAVFKSEELAKVEWPELRRAFLAAAAARTAPSRKAFQLEEEVSGELSRPAANWRIALCVAMLVTAGGAVALIYQQWIIAGICMVTVVIPFMVYARWRKAWRESLIRSCNETLESHRKRMRKAMSDVIELDADVYLAEFRAQAAQVADRAERIGKNSAPLLTKYSEVETAIADVRALLDS